MEPPPPPIVIRESRWKAGAQLAGLALLGAALFNGDPGFRQNSSYILLAALGAAALWVLAQLVRPSILVLDGSGFQVDQFWRSWRVRWSQVSNFRLVQASRSFTRHVAYDYVPDRLSWNEAPTQLPAYWTTSPPDLVELLQQCKDEWELNPPPAPETTIARPPKPALQDREPTVT